MSQLLVRIYDEGNSKFLLHFELVDNRIQITKPIRNHATDVLQGIFIQRIQAPDSISMLKNEGKFKLVFEAVHMAIKDRRSKILSFTKALSRKI